MFFFLISNFLQGLCHSDQKGRVGASFWFIKKFEVDLSEKTNKELLCNVFTTGYGHSTR